jgi:hypothetical protein
VKAIAYDALGTSSAVADVQTQAQGGAKSAAFVQQPRAITNLPRPPRADAELNRARAPPAPGDRCSCTTTITDALRRNFALSCDRNEKLRSWTPGVGVRVWKQECVAGGLPWKHGARAAKALS